MGSKKSKSKSKSKSGSAPEAGVGWQPPSNDGSPDAGSANGHYPAGLGRRRERMQSRVRALSDAEREVARLEQDLENNTAARRQQEASVQAATTRLADLEQALGESSRERTALRAALERARVEAGQARDRAGAAERKYEKAVLGEVVRREKLVDLAMHPE